MALVINQSRSAILESNSYQPQSNFLPSTSGFFKTLTTYLTAAPKTSPKKEQIEKETKLIENWDDVNFSTINSVVCNYLYRDCEYQRLFVELENAIGPRREEQLYILTAITLALIFVQDPVGSTTSFMTIVIPAFFTAIALLQDSDPQIIANRQEFALKYWTVYGFFIVFESFLTSIIKFDLRLFRLGFLSLCLTSRVPILSMTYNKIQNRIIALKNCFDRNNLMIKEQTNIK
ncbi:unnamed protein product [Caenorhabditis angaria]|uniref:Receptor expression-enhancing protein n=1 Tax=Caenorhabditis angaria TaxID=860376 RepID=A0A9P1IBX2_9PELO|nr:unnamed protein product [Caenorhabditis angaria]